MSVLLIGLVIFVAGRGEVGADGGSYLYSWRNTATFWDKSLSPSGFLAYSEPGYYFFTVIIKSIYNNVFFYFAILSFITLSFIFTSLRRYAIYPLMGLAVYMARYFILRDFNQIRAAAAIAIIIYSTRYIEQRNLKKFLICWLSAFFFHISMIIALPFYWLNKWRPSQKQLYMIIIAAFLCSAILNQVFKNIIINISQKLNILAAYTGDFGMTEGEGLLNPMIYFQVIILLLFIRMKPRLEKRQPYYYTIRNGYLYSTIIMILLSSLMVIGSRLSTVFATYDIFIIPALISLFNRKSKFIVVPVLYVLLILLFLINLSRGGDNLSEYGTFYTHHLP